MASGIGKRIGAFAGIMILATGSLMIASCRHQSLGLRTDAERIRTPYFPRITAENLNKNKVTLPDDLKGNPALILVAYKQKQQTNVNTWLDRMDEIEAAIPGVQIIETPTISSGKWGWMAGFIDGGMRSGIPSTEARGRTITLYTDVSLFNQALMIDDTDTIYAVMLDEEGEVAEIIEGDFTPAKLETLRTN
ncbi:MAG: patatin-like phospholipase domain-containing protein [Phycisphaerales bacterium]